MTKEEAIEAIVDGQTPVAYQAHLLSAWEFTLLHGHPPSVEDVRQHLQSGSLVENFWQQGLAQRSTYERT